VEKITKTSPLELVTVLAAVPVAVGAIWGVVQILEKVVNFRLNRKKLQEEVKKLQRENDQGSGQLPPVDEPENAVFLLENPAFLAARLQDRQAKSHYDMVADRLVKAKIAIVGMSIDLYMQGMPGSQDGQSKAVSQEVTGASA